MLGPILAPPSKPGKNALGTRLSVFVWTDENYSNALLVDVFSVVTKYHSGAKPPPNGLSKRDNFE